MLVLYLQDYEAFSEALEDDCLEVFLKLAKPTEVSQAEVTITGVGKMPSSVLLQISEHFGDKGLIYSQFWHKNNKSCLNAVLW